VIDIDRSFVLKYNKVLIVLGVLSVSMEKGLRIRLEPDGKERSLITTPILRQIDSNGRIFVSKDYAGKEALVILAYPIDEDHKEFNPVGKKKVAVYDPYILQRHDLEEGALAEASAFVRDAFHTVFEGTDLEPEEGDEEIFNDAIAAAIEDIIASEGDPLIENEDEKDSLVKELTDVENLREFIENEVDDVAEVDKEEWERYRMLFITAYRIVASACTKLEDEEE